MIVFIIAGEASGDKLGAAMMKGFKEQTTQEIEFIGVGGALMEEMGFTSLFPMEEISLMGISEILSQYRHLKRRIGQTASAVLKEKPDVLITIDLPEFSFRVANLVKQTSNIPTVHYVAPTVWAWRPARARKIAKYIDHLLALFPFEPPLMQAAGMSCDFVGHPVIDDPIAPQQDINDFRSQFGLNSSPVLLCLPGSRRAEIKRLAPVFEKSLAKVKAVHPQMNVVLPAAPSVAELVLDTVRHWVHKPIVLDPREFTLDQASNLKRAAFKSADVALAASGTVSLELAVNQTPMVIAYDMNWISRQVIGRMLQVDSVNLVNLVSNTRTVPEYIGKACQPVAIASAICDVLEAPTTQIEAMQSTVERLKSPISTPGISAAKSVLDFLKSR